MYNQPVVPIISVPVDADGDNDGIIDLYDSQPLDGSNRTPNEKNDEAEEFGIAEHYKTPKKFIIDFTLEENKRYTNEICLHVKPFYDSEQYNDVVLNQGDTVYADYMIISRGLKETYTEDDGSVTEFRRIKYWIKVKVENRYGYLPCEILDFTSNVYKNIKGYIEYLNSTSNDFFAKDDKGEYKIKSNFIAFKGGYNHVAFSQWYYPVPDSLGVFLRVPRFIQSASGPCMALSNMMGMHYTAKEDEEPNSFLSNNFASHYISNGILQ